MNPITNKAPVILLKVKVLLIIGTICSSFSNEFFRSRPDFITNGMVERVINEKIGKTSKTTPEMISPYEIIGKSQKIDVAFSFPTAITKVFRPFDLSAS